MKFIRFILALLFVPFFMQGQDAREIVRQADARGRGKASAARMTIEIVRPAWKRDLSLKAWTEGNDLAMILITAPARDQGTVFLKRKKEVWNWVPSIERNIKLPPSMMSQSWMGTDFTNDDLVKEASIVEDYVHTTKGEETVGERVCYKIELIPKPEAAVVWGKITLWIDKKDFLMMKAEYFDEENELVNTMTSTEVRMLGGRLLPSRMEMVPAGKPGQKTVMNYISLEFDKPAGASFFTPQNMPQVK